MSWILDVLFFVIIILGLLGGTKRGFIAGICKIAGTFLSIAVAFLFCNAFSATLENWFGMTTAIIGGLGNETIGGFLSIAIAFIMLFLIVKLGTMLLSLLATSLVEKVRPFEITNRLLGGILGLAKALIAIFLILTICYWLITWLNLTAFEEFINSSTIVGAIFQWDVFIELAHLKFIFPENVG